MASRKRGIAQPKLVFKLGDGLEILTDGVQWILQDGDKRGYYQSLGTVCTHIIDRHYHRVSGKALKNIKEVRDLMKRAWDECKALEERIKEEAATVQAASKK
jgi:hypothetical protein